MWIILLDFHDHAEVYFSLNVLSWIHFTSVKIHDQQMILLSVFYWAKQPTHTLLFSRVIDLLTSEPFSKFRFESPSNQRINKPQTNCQIRCQYLVNSITFLNKGIWSWGQFRMKMGDEFQLEEVLVKMILRYFGYQSPVVPWAISRRSPTPNKITPAKNVYSIPSIVLKITRIN